IGHHLDMSPAKVSRLSGLTADPVSLDEKPDCLDHGDLAPATAADELQDHNSPSPLEATLARELRGRIELLLRTLTPREGQVLRMRFGLAGGVEQTLEEIGRLFCVTRERIRQIETGALRRMRGRAHLLREFAEALPEDPEGSG